MEYLLIGIVLGLFILILAFARLREKKSWNYGYCPDCGNEWQHFDNDSQGGRGYKCTSCGKHIWISYNVDKLKLIKVKNDKKNN